MIKRLGFPTDAVLEKGQTLCRDGSTIAPWLPVTRLDIYLSHLSCGTLAADLGVEKTVSIDGLPAADISKQLEALVTKA